MTSLVMHVVTGVHWIGGHQTPGQLSLCLERVSGHGPCLLVFPFPFPFPCVYTSDGRSGPLHGGGLTLMNVSPLHSRQQRSLSSSSVVLGQRGRGGGGRGVARPCLCPVSGRPAGTSTRGAVARCVQQTIDLVLWTGMMAA